MSKNNAAGVSGEQAAPSTGNDANPEPPPINPDLRESEIAHDVRPGDVYVRLNRPHSRFFRRIGPGHFEATPESDLYWLKTLSIRVYLTVGSHAASR